jgi:glycosyltransferase involved in cell wall biosynthesis
MRSLYIYTHGYPDADGHSTASRLSWLHLVLLAARGEVDLLALLPLKEAGAAPSPALASLCRRIRSVPAPASLPRALSAVLAGASRGLPPALALKRSAEAVSILGTASAPGAYDLLAFHSAEGLVNLPAGPRPALGGPLRVLLSEEIQWTAWLGGRPRHWRAAGLQQALKSLLWRRVRAFEQSRYRTLDAVFCLSPREEQAVRALDASIPTRLLPLPVGPDAPADAPVRDPVILFTGNFSHPPNRLAAHELALRIFPRVRALLPQARLRLAGRGADSLTACAGAGIERADSLPSLTPEYQAAALLAGPLRTGEGVRGKFLEALACGCPVVTTPLGASGIRAGEPEGLIVRQTAEEIAAAILELLPDPARRRQLGLAGREAVLRHHSRQAFEAAFAAGLDPLLARRGRPS